MRLRQGIVRAAARPARFLRNLSSKNRRKTFRDREKPPLCRGSHCLAIRFYRSSSVSANAEPLSRGMLPPAVMNISIRCAGHNPQGKAIFRTFGAFFCFSVQPAGEADDCQDEAHAAQDTVEDQRHVAGFGIPENIPWERNQNTLGKISMATPTMRNAQK